MPINVANFFEADRRSATAGETITLGMLVKVSDNGDGTRKLMKLLDADSASVVLGAYGIAYKVSVDPAQVNTTTALARTGDRTITIVSGDAVVEVRRGAIVEYSADLLHSSLDPARGGTTPVAGAKLEIKGSQWCTTGTGGAITTLAGRCFQARGTKVLVELV